MKQQHAHTVDSERQYEQQLDTVNHLVTQINTTYRDNLNQLQKQDTEAIQRQGSFFK